MVKLYPYQKEGVRLIVDRYKGRCLLADDMGLGKTVQAISAALELEAFPILVVCKAGLKLNWQREIAFHFGKRSVILGGMKPKKFRKGTRVPPITIINYDVLKKWVKYLRRIKPQCVIIDEVQGIKNRTSQRARATRAICRQVPYVIGLSGTPLTSRPIELWTILNILRPKQFPSFMSFGFRYGAPRKTPWRWEFKGATHVKELHKRLTKLVMVRRRKVDVLKELPKKTRIVVPLPILKRNEYKRASRNFVAWLREHAKPSRIRRAIQAQKLVQMGYLRRLAAELKLAYVHEWIDDYLETGNKLVVFGIHKRVLSSLAERYKGKCVLVDGRVTGRKRQGLIDQFTHSKKTRLILGNIDALGEGTDGLQRVCDTSAFIEVEWVPTKHLQAEDRLHRIGQGNPVFCYYLIAEETIEEMLCRTIQKKQATLRSVLDGANGSDLDVFDLLEKEILKGDNGRKRK